MTITTDGPAYPVDTTGTMNAGHTYARVFRIGTSAVLTDGAWVAAYDQDGEVFAATRYADDSGLGLGELIAYHVHDNADGTFEIYYQIRDADPLPAVLSSWSITIDAVTGLATGPAVEITSGIFGRTNQGMLQAAFDLPDGTIAVIQGPPTMTSARLIIAAPDGTELGASEYVLPASPFNLRDQYDLAIAGDRLALAYTTTAAGAARQTFLQFFAMDGTADGAAITVSEAESSGFGVPGAAQIETLSNGNLVVVWADGGTQAQDDDGGSVWFRIYDAAGVQLVGPTLVNAETSGSQTAPQLVATADGFIVLYTDFDIGRGAINTPVLREYDTAGALLDTMTGTGGTEFIRTDLNTALLLSYEVNELALPGPDGSLDPVRPDPDMTRIGTTGADSIITGNGNDRLIGDAGNDTLEGGDGNDTLNGGDGDDVILAGATEADLRDIVFGGAGNDLIRGGYGNDELRGDAGNDTLDGGFGADTLIGGAGNDVISGGALSDMIFGGDGDDVINGGFGYDRLNGGAGADDFFHLGIPDHGSDWIQDYAAAEGDVLVFGNASASAADFIVQFAETDGAGTAGVAEAFVSYTGGARPQVLWALIDGAAQTDILLRIGGVETDLIPG